MCLSYYIIKTVANCDQSTALASKVRRQVFNVAPKYVSGELLFKHRVIGTAISFLGQYQSNHKFEYHPTQGQYFKLGLKQTLALSLSSNGCLIFLSLITKLNALILMIMTIIIFSLFCEQISVMENIKKTLFFLSVYLLFWLKISATKYFAFNCCLYTFYVSFQ